MSDKAPPMLNDSLAVPRCADCLYCHELPAQLPTGITLVDVSAGITRLLQCRRLPKQMTLAGGLDPVTQQMGLVAGAAFPPVLPDEWCGEFDPLETDPSQKSA